MKVKSAAGRIFVGLWSSGNRGSRWSSRNGSRNGWVCCPGRLQDLANFFKDKQVEKVYLTGSLLREDGFYPFSDIDLAVEGLQEDYFKLLVALEDLMGRWVDVIELEKCRFREQIERQGVRIR